jgi:hypothetical protein
MAAMNYKHEADILRAGVESVKSGNSRAPRPRSSRP